MDLRIVNTCNNNCLYCLESSLRNKEKFIDKNIIFSKITESSDRFNITFYGGNPLMHPDLKEIISFCKKVGYKSIGILTNTYGLNKNNLQDYYNLGLSTIGVYFNSFSKENHEKVNGNGISYEQLIYNIKLISESNLNIKIIIHVNNLNLLNLYKDIYILNKNFGINNIDFVNYFPFDKPYQNRNLLEYELIENRENIISLLKILIKLDIKFNFLKFSKDFFFDNKNYYNFKIGVEKQVGKEDFIVLNSKTKPFCFIEKRCKSCFLKDICKFYKNFDYEI